MGLAVKNVSSADIFLRAQGYVASELIYDPEQNVNLTLYTSPYGSPAVELVIPGEGDGPLTAIFKRANEMIYHTCYETRNLAESLRKLEALGLRVITISEPKPAILFRGKNVSFYRISDLGLIELLEV
jgi:methylmalonyl-CoA/ethylmalonyl-CoA epimerase